MQGIDAKYEKLKDTTKFLFNAHRDVQLTVQNLQSSIAKGKNHYDDELDLIAQAINKVLSERTSRRADLLALREEVTLLAERFDNPSNEVLKPLTALQVAAVRNFMEACKFYFYVADVSIPQFEHHGMMLLANLREHVLNFTRDPNHKGTIRESEKDLAKFVDDFEKGIDEKWNLVAGAYTVVRLSINS